MKILLILLILSTSVLAQTGTINVDQNHTGHKIFGLPTPAAANEAATKDYVDTHGGGGGGGVWGSITGTLSAQTDLQTALDNKQPIDADLTAIAALSGTHNIYYRSASNTWSTVTIGSGLDFTGATLSATGGGGNLSNTGTPLDNQVAVFTDATHVEGNSNLSFDSSTNILSTGVVSPVTGFRINGAAANRRILVGNATNFVQSTETYAVPGTSGNVMQSDGTNWTSAQQNFSGLAGNWTLAQGPSITASKLLGRTDASAGIPQEITLGTNLAMSGTTLNATGGGSIASTTDILKGNGSGGAVALGSATTSKILKSNGTTFVASTETYAAPGTSGNVLTSDGTNWTSAAPVGGGSVSITATSPVVVTPTPLTGTGVASLNLGVDFNWTVAQTMTVTDTATTGATDALTVTHNSSNAGAADFATAIHFKGKSSTTANRDMAQIAAGWLTATDASRQAYVDIRPYALLNNATGLRVYNSGFVTNDTTTDAASAFINSNQGYRVAASTPATGKFLQSNGTAYSNSGYALSATVGAAGYMQRSDGTNFATYPAQLINSSVTSQSPSTADVYLTGSNIVLTAGDFKAKGQYKCVFDMTKSAGTGAIVITLRAGTAGTTSDAAIQTYTFGAGTSVADTGIFEVIATWRTVGGGTSAVIQGICRGTHLLATTGLFNNAAGWVVIGSPSPSAGFASTSFTNIGLSFNGSTAFAGTTTIVQAQLQQ